MSKDCFEISRDEFVGVLYDDISHYYNSLNYRYRSNSNKKYEIEKMQKKIKALSIGLERLYGIESVYEAFGSKSEYEKFSSTKN